MPNKSKLLRLPMRSNTCGPLLGAKTIGPPAKTTTTPGRRRSTCFGWMPAGVRPHQPAAHRHASLLGDLCRIARRLSLANTTADRRGRRHVGVQYPRVRPEREVLEPTLERRTVDSYEVP